MEKSALTKTVLITGASSGIGAACAQLFASHGYRLILTGRREEKLSELKINLEKTFSVEVLTLCFDVQDKKSVFQALNNRDANWQDVDVLVNNAGLALDLAPIQTAEIDDWETMIDTNIKGLLYVTRAILPGMIERNTGYIINVCSTSGHEVYPNGGVYCATKHAVKALSKAFKLDSHGKNIRVTNLSPGMTDTEFSTVRFKGDKARADKVYQGMTPLSAQDIAETIYFCVSRPAHINISELTLMPTAQSSITLVHREN
jgi:3-hydroxy acid dehydrogenase / malonic semialdehyde reductase